MNFAVIYKCYRLMTKCLFNPDFMPFTPFHFGPGLLFKPFLNRYFSFTIFVFTQFIIDLEPLYFILHGDAYIHRFFHTYLGSLVAALIAVIIGKPICQWSIRLWNTRLDDKQKRWLAVSTDISWLTAVNSSLLGAFSHVLLDSFMHSDIKPFAPFSDENGLLQLISLDQLHFFCLVAGIMGLITTVRLNKL